jgi:hypothetical protein
MLQLLHFFSQSQKRDNHGSEKINTSCLTEVYNFDMATDYSKILMISNQLPGHGSVIIPMMTTAGANPHSKRVRDFRKTKSIFKQRSTRKGNFVKLRDPWRRLVTGMI